MKSFTHRFCKTAILLFGLTFPFMATGQPTKANASFIDRFVNAMAFEYQLGEAPETIRLQFEQNPLQLASAANEQMLEQFDKAYETNQLLSDFKSALKNEFTPEYQPKISDWLASDYVQEISQARRDYHTLQGKRKRIITRYDLDQSPAAESRKKMISTLTETTSAGESSIESSVIVFRSVLKALSQLSTQRNFSDVQIEGIINNFRQQQQNQAANSFNREQLIMYNQVSEDVLERYISFWNTETGRWLDKAISESLQAAYQQSAKRFLESVNSNWSANSPKTPTLNLWLWRIEYSWSAW